MSIRRAASVVRLALLAPLVSCASMGGLRQEPLTAGVTRTFPTPLGPTVDATRRAMGGVGIAISEESEPARHVWMLLGEKGMSLFSYGELVRVVAQETDSARTSVYVVTQRRMATNIFAQDDWSTAIFEGMEASLAAHVAAFGSGPVIVAAGTRVRLTWREPHRTSEGELRARRGDTLVVYDPILSREITPLAGQLLSLEVARSRHTSGRTGALVGFAIGTVAGAAAGAASYQPGGIVDYGQGTSLLMGGMLGGLAGALIGTVVGSGIVTENWEPVPLDRLQVDLTGIQTERRVAVAHP